MTLGVALRVHVFQLDLVANPGEFAKGADRQRRAPKQDLHIRPIQIVDAVCGIEKLVNNVRTFMGHSTQHTTASGDRAKTHSRAGTVNDIGA